MSASETSPDAPAVAIVAFSFGKRRREEEPNPSNDQLAAAVVDGVAQLAGAHPLVIAQWEVAKGVRERGHAVDLVVEEPADGSYLSSDDVWACARERLGEERIRTVLPVAQPFLHLPMIRRMIRRDGFAVIAEDTASVTFDDSPRNTQWWTKGKSRLIAYSVLRAARSAAGLASRAGRVA